MRRFLRPAAAPVVTVVAGLALAALALAASHIALRRGVPTLVTYLLASASVAALVAGTGAGWAWGRSLAAVTAPEAKRELAARLPGTMVRLVLGVGAALSAAGLVVAVTRGATASALAAGAVAVGATLATLAVTAALASHEAVRAVAGADAGPVAAAGPRRSLGARLGRAGLGAIVGAAAPAGALALGAAAPVVVCLATLAWVLVLSAAATYGIGREVSAELAGATAGLTALDGPRWPSAGTRGTALVHEVRGLEDATADLAGRVSELRLTRARALERVLQADRLRTQFLANVSHDLRSPLHAIIGFSDLLLRGIDGELGADQRKSVTLIRDNGTQLLRIIQEVLDLARLDAGNLELVKTPTIVAELIEQAVEESRGRFPGLVLEVSTRLDRGLPSVWVDPYRLVQAMAYLLTYAVEATTEGTQRKKVRLLLGGRRVDAPDGAAVEVVVTAPDATVDADEQAHLFDGFRGLTAKSGLGLGPHLARRLVQVHGGQVRLAPAAQGLRLEALIPLGGPAPA